MNQSEKYRAWRVSASSTAGDISEVQRINETWHIEKAADAIPTGPLAGINLPEEAHDILQDTTTGGPVIPDIGDPYPIPNAYVTAKAWQANCITRSHAFRPDGRGCAVDIEYSSRYFYIPANAGKGLGPQVEALANATTIAAGLYLFAQMQPTQRVRPTTIYRDGWTTGPNPANDKSAADIGGTPKRREVDVVQTALRLRLVVDSESLAIRDVSNILNQYAGKKNSAVFYGCAVGTLICQSGSVNHLEHEFWEVILELLYDEWAHQTQVAELDIDGQPKMSQAAPNTLPNYADVRWVREARTGVDFNQIFPAGDLGASQKWQAYTGRWW